MWKPDLSAANQVRCFFMPPNGRTATEPFGSRLQGQPQCSSWMSSLGASSTRYCDGILVAQPVAAAHGVVEVMLEAVVGLDDAGRAALGRAGVAAHRVDLGDQRDAQLRVGLRERDGGAQSRAARADDRYVRLDRLHASGSGASMPRLRQVSTIAAATAV